MRLRRLLPLVAAALVAVAGAQRTTPLPAEEVFRFSAEIAGSDVVAVYQLPEGVYLYRDKLALTVAADSAVRLTPLTPPPGVLRRDEFFGDVAVYYGGVTLRATTTGTGDLTLIAASQGCDEQVGICYPPQRHTVALVAGGDAAADTATGGATSPLFSNAVASAEALGDGNIFYIVALFFVLGLGLSLTPCVLPMLPILAGLIGGGEQSRRRALRLTAAYIAGVVIAFTALGVVAAYVGQLLGAFLQQPAVLIVAALVLAALALSLLGVYSLRLPAFLQTPLSPRGGGAFLMGAASSLIISPCVAAPLVGALLYISQSGDVVVGAAALMSLSLGMSALLAVAGVAGGEILPKAGEWTVGVQRLFGWLLLLVAVWTASPALPTAAVMVLYGGLLLFGGVMTRPLAAEKNAPVLLLAVKAAGLAVLLWGALLLASAAAGGRDPLSPLSPFVASSRDDAPLTFLPVNTVADFKAAAAGRDVMLEFYADWCVTCKEMEYFTFSDDRVRARLGKLTLLRADVTENTAQQRALLAQFKVFGPPAMIFFSRDGAVRARLDGYQNAADFLRTLDAAGI